MYKDDEVFVWSISSIFAQEGMITDVLVYKFPFVVVPEKHMRSPTVSWLILSFQPQKGILDKHVPFFCILQQYLS